MKPVQDMKTELKNKITLTESICLVGDDTIYINKLKKYFENSFRSVKVFEYIDKSRYKSCFKVYV